MIFILKEETSDSVEFHQSIRPYRFVHFFSFSRCNDWAGLRKVNMVKTLAPSPLSHSQLARAPKLPPRISRPCDAKKKRKSYRRGRKFQVPTGSRDGGSEKVTKTIIAGKTAFPSLVSPMEFVRLQNQVGKKAYVNPLCPADSSPWESEDKPSMGVNLPHRKVEQRKKKVKKPEEEPLSPLPPSPPVREKPRVVRSTAEMFQREQNRNVWKLGRLKKKLIIVFKRLSEQTEKLDKTRKLLGTGWNPEPFTMHQKATILKREKLLTTVRSRLHGRMDKIETVKVQVNGIRKDLMHSKNIFQRHLEDLRGLKRKTAMLRNENTNRDIDGIREDIREMNMVDSAEEAKFREELLGLRSTLRKNKLKANKKSFEGSKRGYEPTNAEVYEKGHFSKYIAESALYDTMTEKDKKKMKGKLSHQDWMIQQKLQQKKRQDETNVRLNMAWQAIRTNEPAIVSMEDFVLGYLEHKGKEYKQVSRGNALTDNFHSIEIENKKLEKEIRDQEQLLESQSTKDQARSELLNKIMGSIAAEERAAKEEELRYTKLIENALPAIQRLLVCGIFNGDKNVKDKIILSQTIDYGNVSKVLGVIESRICTFDIGRKNNLHISDKRNVFVDTKIPSPLKIAVPGKRRKGRRATIVHPSKLPSFAEDQMQNGLGNESATKFIHYGNKVLSTADLRKAIMMTAKSGD